MSYIVPIGPYHPALEEPVHADLITDGELITDAKVYIGYNHRGIEKLATQKNFIQTLVMVERVCGICSHSHAFSYAMALEAIAQMEVPKKAQYIRVIISELERLHSHYLWEGIAFHIIGHDSMFMRVWDDREIIMDLLEELTGNRVNYSIITVGGVRRNIDDNQAKRILEVLAKVEKSNKEIIELTLNESTIAKRTQGVGILTTEDAFKQGALGPHARASNVAVDVRKDAPYSSYDDFDFNLITSDTCDVFSRVVVRLLENIESIKIIRQALEKMPKGALNLGTKIPKIPEGEYMVRHEAPRGQLTYKVNTDGGEFNQRVSIHVPTFKNAPTLTTMLKENTVAHAGLIIASIDPCFSCMDR